MKSYLYKIKTPVGKYYVISTNPTSAWDCLEKHLHNEEVGPVYERRFLSIDLIAGEGNLFTGRLIVDK